MSRKERLARQMDIEDQRFAAYAIDVSRIAEEFDGDAPPPRMGDLDRMERMRSHDRETGPFTWL